MSFFIINIIITKEVMQVPCGLELESTFHIELANKGIMVELNWFIDLCVKTSPLGRKNTTPSLRPAIVNTFEILKF